jgi:hypothetical protein
MLQVDISNLSAIINAEKKREISLFTFNGEIRGNRYYLVADLIDFVVEEVEFCKILECLLNLCLN